jgi:TRAP-type transport system small permease protein
VSDAQPKAGTEQARWSATGLAVRLTRGMLGLILIGMVVLNVANAVARYAFGAVLIGADEVLVFGMVWLIMTGMILVTADRSHIALDFLPRFVGPRGSLWLRVLHYTVIAGVCGYAAIQSYAFVMRVTALGQTSMGLALPMYVPHAALLVGFALTSLVALLMLVSDLKTLAAGEGEAAR